jgi:hypothetical protein
MNFNDWMKGDFCLSFIGSKKDRGGDHVHIVMGFAD